MTSRIHYREEFTLIRRNFFDSFRDIEKYLALYNQNLNLYVSVRWIRLITLICYFINRHILGRAAGDN